jgi:hypothetical protein
MCEHDEEMRREWADWDRSVTGVLCGNDAPHAPHEGCLGIMCDYGCNAEYF